MTNFQMVSGVHGAITLLAAQLVKKVFRSGTAYALEVKTARESLKTSSPAIKKLFVKSQRVSL